MAAPQPTDIERAVVVLTREFGATEVWLFGSAATGVATEHSDIDLLVVRPARAVHRVIVEGVFRRTQHLMGCRAGSACSASPTW